MEHRRKKDRMCAFFFIFLSVVLLAIIPWQISAQIVSERVGARLFPQLLAIVLGVLGISLFIGTFAPEPAAAANEAEKKIELKRKDLLPVLYIVLCWTLYIIIFSHLGFIISSILAATAIMIIIKDKVWYHYAIAYVFILAFYFLFTRLLYVHLP